RAAFRVATSGRPGPVVILCPSDVLGQPAEGDVYVEDAYTRFPAVRTRANREAIAAAATLLAEARRPVIVAGGGVISADATGELRALAERLGAPVVTTWNGKGAIDETHPLAGQTIGDTGSTIGNALSASADVILSVGCRFVDWSASSWRAGITFGIPPTQLIQLEIDEREVGKNYPVAVPLLGDARSGLSDLLDALGAGEPRTDYAEEIGSLRQDWEQQVELKSGSDAASTTMARAVREVQAATREDAIVVTGAGLPQGMVKQRWVTRHPRTHLTSGGFSTMGFTLPAAIGAQLAKPDAQVLAICGDGDFLQTMQELASAAMLGTPVCTVVLDNSGWISIKGGQQHHFGRTAITDFVRNGQPYSPDFAAIGRAFGIHAEFAEAAADVRPAVERALASGGPSLVHVRVDRDLAVAGPDKTGWWDVPVPEGRPVYDEQLAGRAEEQHR
ncbi:MAG: thiamine pyrophosphate-binding protein, partial [Candidatus Limnocylindria bacterium]